MGVIRNACRDDGLPTQLRLFWLVFFFCSCGGWLTYQMDFSYSTNSFSNSQTNRTSVSKSNASKKKKTQNIVHPHSSEYSCRYFQAFALKSWHNSTETCQLRNVLYTSYLWLLLFSGGRIRKAFSQAKVSGIRWTSCTGPWSQNDWRSSENLVPESSH